MMTKTNLMSICICFIVTIAWTLEKQESFIFPLQEKHVHGSSIVELSNGDLLACWFYGSGERTANDVLVQGARLKKGDSRWSPVFLMADTPNLPDCNPVLYVDNSDKLWLFWIAVQAKGWENSVLKYRTSTNYLAHLYQKYPPKPDFEVFLKYKLLLILNGDAKNANVVTHR
ncbi:hypothetical protein GF406_21225 [candidate division KSB1 bacterium]|nr:hypothetical protein [candidate division KSB1 bacterium]